MACSGLAGLPAADDVAVLSCEVSVLVRRSGEDVLRDRSQRCSETLRCPWLRCRQVSLVRLRAFVLDRFFISLA